jgi:hypothetical protein
MTSSIRKGILTIALLAVFTGAFAQKKPLYMWFDIEANYVRLSYPDSIAFYFDKLKSLGFTDVVADVKSITGETAFKSDYAPYMQEWGGFTRANGYDMLRVFIDEAHKRGLRAHASLNVFCGAHLYLDRGIIYDKKYESWQSQVYTPDGIMPISKVKPNYNGMLNPALPEVRDYELNILKEVVSKYKDLDGIILDRVRYDGITSDFSNESKAIFEKYASVKLNRFPEDIMYWQKDNGNFEYKPGKYFNKWVEWRASLIYSFVRDVRKELKAIKPDLMISDYAGSWYPSYYEVGVNWASSRYDPSKDYSWATKRYKKYGYAELLDEFQAGLYYAEVTTDELNKRNAESIAGRTEPAMGKGRESWYSVEGAARLSKKVVCNAVPVVGSIYADQYKDDSKQFSRAITMALKESDGLMVFDMVHIIKRNMWDALKQGIDDSGVLSH